MSARALLLSLSTLSLLALSGCSEPSNEPKVEPPSAAAAKLALTADPGEALGVAEAKAKGPQDKVVVHGRVCDITKGFAVMKLMDKSFDYCGEIDEADRCATPWDYCCDTPEDRKANSLLVEARDENGKPLATPSLPNTRLVDHVKVTGKMTKDEHGNLVLLADGIYRIERPKLPDYVKWPQ